MSHPNIENAGFADNRANRDYQVEGPAGPIQEAVLRMGIDKVDEAVARELIDNASVEDTMQVLDYVNATVCGSIDRPNHTDTTSTVESLVDDKRVVHQMLLPPRHRVSFMRYALEKAKNVTDIARKANVLAYGTVLSHNFADGNGRTARVVAAMVAEGFDPSSEESVANLNTVATSRDKLPQRTASFVPDYSMKRSWIATEIDKRDQFGLFTETQKQMDEQLVTTSKDGKQRYVDPDKINSRVGQIADTELRHKIIKTVQQDEFGILALGDVLALTQAEDITEGLSRLDTTTAQLVIEKDEDRKLAYSEFIIDIAAGEAKPYYAAYGQPPEQGALTDQYMVGYH